MTDNTKYSGYSILKRRLARTEVEKSVLLKALDLQADPKNATKQADLALALEQLDAERDDVSHAIAKALARPTNGSRYRVKLT